MLLAGVPGVAAGDRRAAGLCLTLAGLALYGAALNVWPRDTGDVTLSVRTAPEVTEVADEAPGLRPPLPHESSVRRIAAVLRELGLPLPERITLHLYESPTSFERGLIDVGGLAPAAARKMGEFAVGVSFEDTLLMLEAESRRGQRAWLRLLAHEMAHLSQIELAGAEERGDRWLSEGMAEWIAFTVLDRLGVSPMAEERARLLKRGREVIFRAGNDLGLAELGRARGFLDRARRVGPMALYNASFLLADHLIQRHGFPALIGYFRLFASRNDHHANFAEVFGQRLGDFEREIVTGIGPDEPSAVRQPEPRLPQPRTAPAQG